MHVFLTNFNIIPQTNVIEFSNLNNNNLIPSLDESDNNFLTSSSTQINSKDVNYKPEVGIRIALMLGSLMCLIILYLLWRNRCHCLLHRFGLSVSVLKFCKTNFKPGNLYQKFTRNFARLCEVTRNCA